MSHKLLTIAIPTYNRARHLELLLGVLASELQGLSQHVEVMIFDNASTDSTPEVAATFQARYADCRIVRHAQNIGSAPNFLACFNAASSRYFWLMGDDDAPAKGLLTRLVDLLMRESLDMVYVHSHWAGDIAPLVSSMNVPAQPARIVGKASFARRTHVYLTFISSVIVNRKHLLESANAADLKIDMGQLFVQLSWTFCALKSGEKFAIIDGACILATQGNSGGYGAMTAFGCEFPRAVRKILGDSKVASILIERTLVCYLPGLAWAIRMGKAGRVEAENPWPELRRELGALPLFWALLVPIGRFPKFAAMPFYQAWRVLARLIRDFNRLLPLRRQPIGASK